MFESLRRCYLALAIVSLLLATVSGCGNRSPIVTADATASDYAKTGFPQLSKPIPPEVMGGIDLVAQPSLRMRMVKCCHELRKSRIGGKVAPHTGCDCDVHHLYRLD